MNAVLLRPLAYHEPQRIVTLEQALTTGERSSGMVSPPDFNDWQASLSENIAIPKFRTVLFAIFSGLATLLAIAGVYGVIAFMMGRRTGEIGLRMALGANSGDIRWLVLREGLMLTSVGLAIGLGCAMLASRLLTTMLFEVKAIDPMIYAGVALSIGCVSLAACYIPAMRAAKIDPLIALRHD